MSARTLPNVGLSGFWALGENGYKTLMDLNLLKLSALVQAGAISLVTSLPGSPTDGDIHVLSAAAGSHPTEIAIRDAGAWVYVTPLEGWLVFVRADNVFYYFDASDWVPLPVFTAASNAETTAGALATKGVTPSSLAHSDFGKQIVSIQVTDPNGTAITTGDGKAYFRVPSALNGMNLVAVAAAVTTASSSGVPTVQIANVTDAVDMLSTKLTIDASETDSSTATTAAVIDTTRDDVATGDLLRIDIDVAGTGTKGLIVEMQFQLP